MNGLQLMGAARALPSRCVTNQQLSQQVDTTDEWVRTRTGIGQRYFCTKEESAVTLAAQAAQKALLASGVLPQQIGCVVCATLSSNKATPSMACQLQQLLGLPEEIPALDVNAACSGFLYGVVTAAGLLESCGGEYALVVGAEQLSKLLDMTDRSTCVLFGDGAGAAVFKPDSGESLAPVLGCRGSDAIWAEAVGPVPSRIRMDGKAVFRFAVETVPWCVNKTLQKACLTLDQVDWVICHQANARILDHCIKKLQAPGEKFYQNIEFTGNTSAASIPILLGEMWEKGLLSPGQRLLCVGFGAGLTWAGLTLRVGQGKKGEKDNETAE